MPSLNKIVLIGRLTRDPEKRYTTSGLAVTSFSIAVDRRAKNQQGERQTDFFRCSAWRQTAEFVADYVTKGRLVAVEGRIEINEYVGQDGQKRQSADVVCDNVETLDSNREQGEGGGGYSGGSTPGASRAPQNNEAPADGGNGYFPDDDMAATPQSRAPQRPAGGAVNPNAGATRPAAPTRAPQGNRPVPAAQPAYPENDFDDSDPFADE